MNLDALKNMSMTDNTVAVYTGAAGEWTFLLLYVAFVAATYLTTKNPLITSAFTWLSSTALLAGDLFLPVNLVQTGSEPFMWATTVLSLAAWVYLAFFSKR